MTTRLTPLATRLLALGLLVGGWIVWSPVIRAAEPATGSRRPNLSSSTTSTLAVPVILAEGWSIKKYMGGLTNRTRIVQFCVVVMILALVILCKKLAAVEPVFRAAPTVRPSGSVSDRSDRGVTAPVADAPGAPE